MRVEAAVLTELYLSALTERQERQKEREAEDDDNNYHKRFTKYLRTESLIFGNGGFCVLSYDADADVDHYHLFKTHSEAFEFYKSLPSNQYRDIRYSEDIYEKISR